MHGLSILGLVQPLGVAVVTRRCREEFEVVAFRVHGGWVVRGWELVEAVDIREGNRRVLSKFVLWDYIGSLVARPRKQKLQDWG